MKKISKIIGLYLVLFSVFFSCENSDVDKIEYDSLSNDEKRLPDNAVFSMIVNGDYDLNLFASEPMITNPTNIAIDAKGRIWMCEGRNYRNKLNPNNKYFDEGDRILILEDTNGDGIADSVKVFYQGEDINSALGIAVFGDKIIVSASPNVFVFTDEDGDDIPEKKEILFSGIAGVDHDHGVHSFIFGPDGRLYFNFGNEGRQLKDKNGNLIRDKNLNVEIEAKGSPFYEGMAFRCEMDGSDVEVLGHNFRNPYELTVNSFGEIWQSDNDDDGNRAVRINYLMEYGNYGFKDLLTGNSWQERRIGWSDSIPIRHWHLNDPGTVPNILMTGSGSPSGIVFYENNLMFKNLGNRLIHAEPGHNVLRSYIAKGDGAGYTAEIENIINSKDDWFRPVDVAIAPDGSLFVADWYDGGVGGHKMEDYDRGRIYRLSEGKNYSIPQFDLSSIEGAAKGLISGNMDVFYQSWQYIHQRGENAEEVLNSLIQSGGVGKSRALWLGSLIGSKADKYIDIAIRDTDEKIRAQGLRMARYSKPERILDYVQVIINDPSSMVRREAAICLRHEGTEEAAKLWAELAIQYEGNDRWELESLGIGTDMYPDLYFGAWKKRVGNQWDDAAGRGIVWRVHAEETVPLISEILRGRNLNKKEIARFYRALQFKNNSKKNEILFSILKDENVENVDVKAFALGEIDKNYIDETKDRLAVVREILPEIEGTSEWLTAIGNLNVKNEQDKIFQMVVSDNIGDDVKKHAIELLIDTDKKLIEGFLSDPQNDNSIKQKLIKSMGSVNRRDVIKILFDLLDDNKSNKNSDLMLTVIESLGNSYGGQYSLYQTLEREELSEDLMKPIAIKLMSSWNPAISEAAKNYLASDNLENENISELMEMKGDGIKGKEVFGSYCSSCHVVDGSGIEFGPELSDIGNKLSKEFLFSSIIYPSSGISFGYEGYIVKLKNGTSRSGYILSQSENSITLKMIGGSTEKISRNDIEDLIEMENSLMPEGLHNVMTKEELVDLVAYLQKLKIS